MLIEKPTLKQEALQTRNKIKDFIASNQIEAAILALKNTLRNRSDESYDEVIGLHARYNDLAKRIRNNLVDSNGINLEKAAINSSLLQITNEAFSKERDEPVLIPEFKPKKVKPKKMKLGLVISIAMGIVGFMLFNLRTTNAFENKANLGIENSLMERQNINIAQEEPAIEHLMTINNPTEANATQAEKVIEKNQVIIDNSIFDDLPNLHGNWKLISTIIDCTDRTKFDMGLITTQIIKANQEKTKLTGSIFSNGNDFSISGTIENNTIGINWNEMILDEEVEVFIKVPISNHSHRKHNNGEITWINKACGCSCEGTTKLNR